ncbi:MAG: GNAT family N-acetyltransferase [Candidatus Omnitrophota bacterium]|nr:GNAT family N-acetyltransferase [Candidatus Omnitrophota bacterium]MDZ4243224.1 GNAT family N-acetyltransferase [Candidatus Omnitrophota bacterium]
MFQLHEISESGAVAVPLARAGKLPEQVLAATASFYRRAGFHPPWVSYLAVAGGEAVGCCSFKSGPRDGCVEIAYFTFPPHEGKGFATKMAEGLIAIAGRQDKVLRVTARTLPEENASTAIMKKLGFVNQGPVQDPEDGTVWEWSRRP